MPIEIRPITADEFDACLAAEAVAWGSATTSAQLDLARGFVERERVIAAVDGGRFVGSAAMLSLRLAVPGGRIRMAGLTFVYVHPTHRRRGLLRRMMDAQLELLRDGGEPVSGLFAAESGIYRRFGYGPAMQVATTEIERAHSGLRDGDPGGRVEVLEGGPGAAAAAPLHEAVAACTNGMVDRPPGQWAWHFDDPVDEREGFGPLRFAVHHGDRGADGYAAYRIKERWDDEIPRHLLSVRELVATSPDAEEALWRFVFGHDLVECIRADERPLEEPLVHLLHDPRRLRHRSRDGLHLRPVDVAAALAGRRYGREDGIVLRVVDPLCPWVAGVFRLDGGLDGAACARVDAAPDLVLDAAALGSVLLGDVPVELLVRAGRVEEVTPGAARRATAMFAWSPRPWSPGMF